MKKHILFRLFFFFILYTHLHLPASVWSMASAYPGTYSQVQTDIRTYEATQALLKFANNGFTTSTYYGFGGYHAPTAIRILIDAKADVNATSEDRQPILRMIFAQITASAQLLHAKKDFTESASLKDQRHEVTKQLIEAGANVHARDRWGDTILKQAIEAIDAQREVAYLLFQNPNPQLDELPTYTEINTVTKQAHRHWHFNVYLKTIYLDHLQTYLPVSNKVRAKYVCNPIANIVISYLELPKYFGNQKYETIIV